MIELIRLERTTRLLRSECEKGIEYVYSAKSIIRIAQVVDPPRGKVLMLIRSEEALFESALLVMARLTDRLKDAISLSKLLNMTEQYLAEQPINTRTSQVLARSRAKLSELWQTPNIRYIRDKLLAHLDTENLNPDVGQTEISIRLLEYDFLDIAGIIDDVADLLAIDLPHFSERQSEIAAVLDTELQRLAEKLSKP